MSDTDKGSIFPKDKEEIAFLEKSRFVDMDVAQKLDIFRKCGGRIEAMENPSLEEKILVKGIKRGYMVYYTLYSYKFQGEEALRELEHSLVELYEKFPSLRSLFYQTESEDIYCLVGKRRKSVFSVYDISGRKEPDKKKIMQNFILKERKTRYLPFSMPMINVNIFKWNEEDYICIVSLCEQGEVLKRKERIFEKLFHTADFVEMDKVSRTDEIPLLTCANYWRSILSKIPNSPNMEMKNFGNGLGTELFVLDDDLAGLLSDFSEESGIELKELFLTIWGTILCKTYNKPEVVIGEAHDGGILAVSPIRIKQDPDMKRILFDIKEQLYQRKKYNKFSLEEFKQKQNLDLMQGIFMIQNFGESDGSRLISLDMCNNTVYQIRPYQIPEVPLQIDYNISSAVMRMVYTYNKRMFDNIAISKFHETFQMLAKGMLEIIKNKFSTSVEKVTEQAMRVDTSKIIMNKAYYLKKSILFDSYEIEELLDFTKQCRVVDYQIGETISEEQSGINNLYIIAKGKVEVSRTNADSFLVPVQILREGGIIGIESLTKDAFSENKYIAYSDSVKLVEVQSTTLWKEVIKHPEIMQALIEYQCKQLDKFQSLWTMG